MNCKYCGAPLNGTEKFCGECGAKTEVPAESAASAVPELTLTPPESLLDELGRPEIPTPPEIVPTSAESIVNAEPPEAPGAAPMPEVPAPEPVQTAVKEPESAKPVIPAAAPVRPQQNPNTNNYRNPYVQQPQSRPNAAPVSSGDDPNRVLSTGGFLLSLFLMSLPIVGLVMQIVWSCNGTTDSLNRRNLARGYLILTCIGIVFAIALIVFVGVFAGIAALF